MSHSSWPMWVAALCLKLFCSEPNCAEMDFAAGRPRFNLLLD